MKRGIQSPRLIEAFRLMREEKYTMHAAAKLVGISPQSLFNGIRRHNFKERPVIVERVRYSVKRFDPQHVGLTYTGRDIHYLKESSPAKLGVLVARRVLLAALIGSRSGMQEAEAIRKDLADCAREFGDPVRLCLLIEPPFVRADAPEGFHSVVQEYQVPEWLQRGCRL
jgi:hypothetical protein